MGERKGLVVERRGSWVTLMTQDGAFIRVKTNRPDLLVGEEVTLPPARSAFWWWRRAVLVTALTCIFVIATFFSYAGYLQARPSIAYLTLDSAGSIELEVNDRGLVKSAVAFDAEGQKALSAIDYRLRPVEQVIESLVRQGTVKQDEGVVLAVVPIRETPKVDEIEKKVTEKAQVLLRSIAGPDGTDQEHAFPVSVLRLDLETRDKAAKLKITAGKAAALALRKHSQDALEKSGAVSLPAAPPPPKSTSSQEQGVPSSERKTSEGESGPEAQHMDAPDAIQTPEQAHTAEAAKGLREKGKGDSGGFGDLEDILKETDPKERAKAIKDITRNWLKKMLDEPSGESHGESQEGSAVEKDQPPAPSDDGSRTKSDEESGNERYDREDSADKREKGGRSGGGGR